MGCFQIPFFSSIKKAGPNKRLLRKTQSLTSLWCWWAWGKWNPVFREQGMGKCHSVHMSIRINHPGYFKGIKCPPTKSWFHSLNWKAWCCLVDTLNYHGRIIKSPKKPQHIKPTKILGLQENLSVREKKAHSSLISGTEGRKKVLYSCVSFQCSLFRASCSSSCFNGSHSRTEHFNIPCSGVCGDSQELWGTTCPTPGSSERLQKVKIHLENSSVLQLSPNQLFGMNFVQLMMLIACLADCLEFETI